MRFHISCDKAFSRLPFSIMREGKIHKEKWFKRFTLYLPVAAQRVMPSDLRIGREHSGPV
jgi:hypothetical protein